MNRERWVVDTDILCKVSSLWKVFFKSLILRNMCKSRNGLPLLVLLLGCSLCSHTGATCSSGRIPSLRNSDCRRPFCVHLSHRSTIEICLCATFIHSNFDTRPSSPPHIASASNHQTYLAFRTLMSDHE